MKRIFRSLAALLIIVISFSAISFAWLASGKYLNFPSSFGGSATPAYFAGGDGSEDNPFRITNAVHLYNLAWLQYLGYFNQREDFNNGLDQTYFELGKDVDMRGRAIPPIGTEEYPFIGQFNGNGKTVRNLTISNKKGTDNLVKAPTNAKFSSTNDMLCHVNGDNSEVEIVGMFGVTGDYDGYFNKYKAGGHTVDGTIASVSNFYVDKIHVRSNSAKTLAGLAAGYIGGNFSNVGVYRSDIKFAANAQSIDNATIVSSGVLSQYSLVGAYNEDLITWDDGAIGWGNSINIQSLYERLDSFYGSSNDSGDNKYKHYFNSSEGSLYAKKYGNIFYISGGKVTKNSNNEITGASYDMSSTVDYSTWPSYLPIKTKSDTDYTVADDNTGYMAGGPFDRDGDIRIRKYPVKGSTGLNVSTNDKRQIEEGGKNIEILTITKNTYDNTKKAYTLRRILDSYNYGNSDIHPKISGITKNTYNADIDKYPNPDDPIDPGLGLEAYKDARKEFNNIIANEKDTERSTWYGFHFMKAQIGTNNMYYAPQVTINGRTYTTKDNPKGYQLTADSIDFQTQSKGHISFFASSSFSGNRNFFALHEIFRDTNDPCVISEIREISKIYSSGDDYVYLYKDGGVSAGEASDLNDENLEFDCAWINNTYAFSNNSMINNAIYYFEIPVNKGEFALGSDTTNAGGYLLYLDIGANGNQTPTGTGYTMDKVRFINYSGMPSDGNGNVNLSAYKPALITLSGSSTAEETAVFKRDEDETDGKLKLAYRIINNNANAIKVNETTKNMTREDPDLQPSKDTDT